MFDPCTGRSERVDTGCTARVERSGDEVRLNVRWCLLVSGSDVWSAGFRGKGAGFPSIRAGGRGRELLSTVAVTPRALFPQFRTEACVGVVGEFELNGSACGGKKEGGRGLSSVGIRDIDVARAWGPVCVEESGTC